MGEDRHRPLPRFEKVPFADVDAADLLDISVNRVRESLRALGQTLAPRHLAFIDEASSHVGMTRDYACVPCMGTCRGTGAPYTTMIGAMGLKGVRPMMTVEGATDGEVFEAFVEHLLVPKLNPGDIVVLDNAGAHKPEAALARIRAGRSLFRTLPRAAFTDLGDGLIHPPGVVRLLMERSVGVRTVARGSLLVHSAVVAYPEALAWGGPCDGLLALFRWF